MIETIVSVGGHSRCRDEAVRNGRIDYAEIRRLRVTCLWRGAIVIAYEEPVRDAVRTRQRDVHCVTRFNHNRRTRHGAVPT